MKDSVRILYVFALICFIVSAVMIYKGYDKMTNYRNSETYYSSTVNAYVGGDAYNYIINGTYSTSYFTLASGFMISGILCVVGGMIVKAIDSKQLVNDSCLTQVDNNIQMDEELPPL